MTSHLRQRLQQHLSLLFMGKIRFTQILKSNLLMMTLTISDPTQLPCKFQAMGLRLVFYIPRGTCPHWSLKWNLISIHVKLNGLVGLNGLYTPHRMLYTQLTQVIKI